MNFLDYLASEGGISLLDVNPGLMIWTVITFLLVFFVLKWQAWKPITDALDERANKINSDIDRAEDIKNEAEQKLNEYVERLEGLKGEGYQILAEAKKNAEALRDEILDSAKKEAQAIKQRGIRDAKLAIDQAIVDVHREAANLSVLIAGQILGKTLSADDHKKIISDTIEKFKSLN